MKRMWEKTLKSIVVSEETESEVPEEIEMALNYLYINEAEQQGGDQQSIVLSWETKILSKQY